MHTHGWRPFLLLMDETVNAKPAPGAATTAMARTWISRTPAAIPLATSRCRSIAMTRSVIDIILLLSGPITASWLRFFLYAIISPPPRPLFVTYFFFIWYAMGILKLINASLFFFLHSECRVWLYEDDACRDLLLRVRDTRCWESRFQSVRVRCGG